MNLLLKSKNSVHEKAVLLLRRMKQVDNIEIVFLAIYR